MYAVVGCVKIKPGHEEETRSTIAEGGVPMVQGMAGSAGGWWARTLEGETIRHSFWVFDTEENARSAEATFSRVRDARRPATFVSVDVCEVLGRA